MGGATNQAIFMPDKIQRIIPLDSVHVSRVMVEPKNGGA